MSKRASRISAFLIVAVVLVGVLAPTVCAASASAFIHKGDDPVQPALLTSGFSCAQEDTRSLLKYLGDFSRALYENKDIGATHNLRQYTEGDLLDTYLSEKVAVHQLVTRRAFLEKKDFRVEAEPTVIEALDKGTYFVALAVRVSFNYVGMEGTSSGYGEILNLVVSDNNGSFKALDVYAQDNYYDMELRGNQVDLKYEYKKRQSPQFTEKSEIVDKAKRLKDRVESYYDALDKKAKHYQPEISAANPEATTLNKAAIATYARNYCRSSSPPSGGSSVPYYDFSTIPGNYDCTNFASHSLLAGGATPYNNGDPGTGWYYVDLDHRSYSWSGVGYFFSYLTRGSTTPGPYGTSFAYYVFDERQGYPYSNGDILQHKSDSTTWMHTTIITGVYSYSPSYPYYLAALVCGRTGVGRYNYNQKAEEIYPGYDKRVIRLNGNR